MLITNGIVTRNIAAKQFAEYMAKGYEPVKVDTPKPKKAAKTKAGDK